MHIVLEGRSEGRDWETEGTVPDLTNSAGGHGAVGIASGAREVLVKDIGTGEEAVEVNMIQSETRIIVPDTLNCEILGTVGADRVWVSIGAVIELDPVLLARDLVNSNGTVGIRGGGNLDHLWDLGSDSSGSKGSNREFHN